MFLDLNVCNERTKPKSDGDRSDHGAEGWGVVELVARCNLDT